MCLAVFLFFNEVFEGDRPARSESDLRVTSEASAGAVAFHDEQFGFARVAGLTVGELAGESGRFERRFPASEFFCLFRRSAGFCGLDGLGNSGFGGVGMLLEIRIEVLMNRARHDPVYFAVAEFRLGLALELRVRMLHRNDGSESLADVAALQILAIERSEQPVFVGVAVDHSGESGFETREMR